MSHFDVLVIDMNAPCFFFLSVVQRKRAVVSDLIKTTADSGELKRTSCYFKMIPKKSYCKRYKSEDEMFSFFFVLSYINSHKASNNRSTPN